MLDKTVNFCIIFMKYVCLYLFHQKKNGGLGCILIKMSSLNGLSRFRAGFKEKWLSSSLEIFESFVDVVI